MVNTELLMKRFKQSGLTYNQLAQYTKVSRNTIYNVMYGRTTPSYFVTTQLAEALDLSSTDIMCIFFPMIKLKRELTNM